MAGNPAGGKLAAKKNLANNPNFYSDLGKLGAAAYSAKPKDQRKPRGFSVMSPEQVSAAGRQGGYTSRRGKSKKV